MPPSKLVSISIKYLICSYIIHNILSNCQCQNLTRIKRTIKRPDKIEAIHNFLYKPKDAKDTRFHLYTRRNPHKGQELMIGNKKSLLLSSFKPELPIKFIISGWLDNRFFAKWVRMAIQSLLLHGDYNVIYVSWRSIKELFVAAMMIKLFSADLAQFIIFLKHSYGMPGDLMHCIGHSLGAFLCGFAGDYTYIGRVTDAGPRPWFQSMHEKDRINRWQAGFVDVIHSDFNPLFSLGLTVPFGDIDFYPNSGTPQPGCIRDKVMKGITEIKDEGPLVGLFQWARYTLFCSHYRSHEWFFESVRNKECKFVAVRCPSYEMYVSGECGCDTSPHSCAIMGLEADEVISSGLTKYTPQGQWFIKTTDYNRETGKHCVFQYQVQVQLGHFFPTSKGALRILMHTSNGNNIYDELSSRDGILVPNIRFGILITRPTSLGHIKGLSLSWVLGDSEDNHFDRMTYNHKWITVQYIKVAPIQVYKKSSQVKFFCGKSMTISLLRSVTLEPC